MKIIGIDIATIGGDLSVFSKACYYCGKEIHFTMLSKIVYCPHCKKTNKTGQK